jgi:fermentation-respiration switch protein FrsA (DUF1100 family)
MAHRAPGTVLVFAIVMACGCTALESSLLYHPVRSTDTAPLALTPPLQDVELRTADGIRIQARWCPHAQAQGALLYCPGNAGNLDGRARLVHELWEALGESVLIFDYPGYGRSDGTPTEAGCYAAAEAAYQWLSQQVPPERIVFYGESLGGGVAVEMASRHPHRALVLVRTFSSIADVAQAQLSAFARLLVTSRFDSLAKIGKCGRPIFIAQADRDRVIPFVQGERLYSRCPGPAELYRLQGLDHNDPLPAAFYSRLRAFLQTQAAVTP